MIIKTKK